VVTMQLLEKLKVKPERSSIIKMISVHGESKRALGEISNFPFNVEGSEIPMNVVVTDANSYQVLDQLYDFEENQLTSSLNEELLSDSMENNSTFSLNETIIHIEDQSSSSLENQITSLNKLIVNEDQIEYTFNSLENQLDQTSNEDKEPPECHYNSVENYLTIYFDEMENNEADKTQIENLDKENLKDSIQIIKFDRKTSIWNSDEFKGTYLMNFNIENILTMGQKYYNSLFKGKESLWTNHERITSEGTVVLSTNPRTFPSRLEKQKEIMMISIRKAILWEIKFLYINVI
ncbi:16471_t:CDS:2, partial [Acaulospora morrowiae]